MHSYNVLWNTITVTHVCYSCKYYWGLAQSTHTPAPTLLAWQPLVSSGELGESHVSCLTQSPAGLGMFRGYLRTEEVGGLLYSDMPILSLHLSPGKSIYSRLYRRKRLMVFMKRVHLCSHPSASAELEKRTSHLSVRLFRLVWWKCTISKCTARNFSSRI